MRFIPDTKIKNIYYACWRFYNNYNPRQIYRSFIYKRQRIRRGWSDPDWWSMDYYLKDIIPQMLRKYADDGHGYPGTHPYDSSEKWNKALREAADDIEAWYVFDENVDFPNKKDEIDKYFSDSQKAQQRTIKGMHWVAENFLSLWD